jgi:hypothetical protein
MLSVDVRTSRGLELWREAAPLPGRLEDSVGLMDTRSS